MALLLFLRQRFVWWPLHPLGFPIVSNYTIVYYDWLVIFMAWLAKTIVLRYRAHSPLPGIDALFFRSGAWRFFYRRVWVFIDGYIDYRHARQYEFQFLKSDPHGQSAKRVPLQSPHLA